MNTDNVWNNCHNPPGSFGIIFLLECTGSESLNWWLTQSIFLIGSVDYRCRCKPGYWFLVHSGPIVPAAACQVDRGDSLRLPVAANFLHLQHLLCAYLLLSELSLAACKRIKGSKPSSRQIFGFSYSLSGENILLLFFKTFPFLDVRSAGTVLPLEGEGHSISFCYVLRGFQAGLK